MTNAFALEVWSHRDALRTYAYSRRFWHNEADLEDGVSDTIARALQNAAKFNPAKGALRAWLVTIMHRLRVNAYRWGHERHETRLPEYEGAEFDTRVNPEATLIAKEHAHAIANARAEFVPDDPRATRWMRITRRNRLLDDNPWAKAMTKLRGGYLLAESAEAIAAHPLTSELGRPQRGKGQPAARRFYGIERDAVAWVFKTKEERAAWIAADPAPDTRERVIATRAEALKVSWGKPDGRYMLSPVEGWVMIERRY